MKITRGMINYINDIVLLLEENGFLQSGPYTYKKTLDISTKKRVIVFIDPNEVTVCFKHKYFDLFFETSYHLFSYKNVHLKRLKDIINTSDIYDIFDMFCDYYTGNAEYRSLHLNYYENDIYMDTYFSRSYCLYFVIKESNANVFLSKEIYLDSNDSLFNQLT